MPRRKKSRPFVNKVSSKNTTLQGNSERHIVVLFADVVGCSEISNHKKLKQYNDFISNFQDIFREVCEYYKNFRYEERDHPFFRIDPRGDEGCLKIFCSKNDDNLPRDIDTAINIAFDLKRKWLFQKHNIERIEDDGLLPVDIGIGIHAGKVWVNKEENNEYRPEGYAINLAKRIESASRDGSFTHILLSEAARGKLHNLRDEDIYRFDAPFSIKPKGISRDIKVFEIKHHFLRTNWDDIPEEVSMIYNDIDDEKVGVVRRAYEANPTNLWLAEEYIALSIINGQKTLVGEGQEENIEERKKKFNSALEVARKIANSELRDAGTLTIWGGIEGERGEYNKERKLYKEANEIDSQDGRIHWYIALAISYELYEEQDDDINIGDFYKNNRDRIDNILKEYEKATELKPFNPWFKYDYACELSWWSKADTALRKTAIKLLIDAFVLNSDTKEQAKNEEYLEPIIGDPQVKKHL